MRLRIPKTRAMLRREAANWLVRLQSGRDPDVERKFERWHDLDPKHAAAFERVRRSYDQASLLRNSPALARRSDEPAPSTPALRPRYAFAAAAAAAMIPVGLLILSHAPFAVGSSEVLMLATRVGEIRTVKLSDGSKVTLDTATSVEVEIGRSARKARVKSGRARFAIAQGARPFLVEAGSASVETSRAVVDVDRAGGQDRVEVLAGTATVRQPKQQGSDALLLGPGQAISRDEAGLAQKGDAPPGPDWTRGMLQFDGTPVTAAVALANRYSNKRILIDESLGQLRVSGAFRAGDVEGLAKALAVAFHLSLRHSADGDLILSARVPPQTKK